MSLFFHIPGTQKFGYRPGKTYEYDYTADIDTTMQGAAEDKSGLKLTAKVDLNVVSKCEINMRVCKTIYNEWVYC